MAKTVEKKVEKIKQRRYVQTGKVETYKKQGWSVIEIMGEKMKKIIAMHSDLVLMEK